MTLSGAKRAVMWSVTLPSEVTALDCMRSFEKVYFNVLSKFLENALITLWSAAENFRSILGDIIN